MRTLLLALILAVTGCGHSKPAPQPLTNTTAAQTSTPFTAVSLKAFAEKRFPAAIQAGTLTLEFGSADVDREVVEEAGIMGITTVEQFAAIIPADYETKGIPANANGQNLASLVRDLLVIKDAELYFTKAFRNAYASGGAAGWPAAAAYGVDLTGIEARGLMGETDSSDGGGMEE